ncbi:hypothetical protein ACQKF2_16765 [Pseudomonas hunanensis]|uniref:hypothetical protein n=1 Tax=Pseudomonas hunanensis TaxID=1247546 RepID=UPI003D07D0EC
MATKTTEVQGLMKSCQRGVAGKGPAIEAANNLLAECYGLLGKLAAENEALRKKVADDERNLDALLAHCDDSECPTCAQIICPHGGAMHFHHDGCPSCAAHEEAMAKEAQP